MKQLNLIRNLFSVAVMITLACNVSAQVSIRDRIQIMDRDIFNYPELTEAPVKTKKSKTNRIVYSDRTGNQSYEDPYFQRKRSSHGIGTPYYIVGEKNGTYIVHYSETLDANNDVPMTITITFSAEEIIVGSAALDNRWPKK